MNNGYSVQQGLDGFDFTGEFRVPRDGDFFESKAGGAVWVATNDWTRRKSLYAVSRNILRAVSPELSVTVKRTETFVVTIDGHEHELTEQAAYALFRALDKVL